MAWTFTPVEENGARRLVTDPSQKEFSPDGEGYDYETAIAAGMKPGSDQHWGSVAPVPEGVREKYGLPAESYVVLKGAKHPTWNKAVEGERARGFKVVRLDDRYYSVPAGWDPQDVHPSTGKPILKNQDGSISTEETITVEVDGRNLVLPTIVNGKRVSPQEAVELYRRGGNKAVGEFGSQEEADAYAQQRSNELGRAAKKWTFTPTEEKTGASAPPPAEYGVVDLIKDTGLDFAQGAVDLGQSAVGIADIFAGNRVGKAMSDLGYRPEETEKIIRELHSEERKRQDAVVQAASGFWGTAQALGENPLSALGTISRSAPLTLSGAAVVRAAALRMMAREGIKVGSLDAAKFLTRADVVDKLTKIGTATEGLQAAGLNQEQARQAGKDWGSTVLPSVAAGIGTGLIGYGSSKIIPDVETTLATRGLMPGSRASLLARGKDVAKGILKEGGEETLQSGQEQMWSNVALDKPLMQGVPESMAQGAVAGMGMGGGMSGYSNVVDEARGIQDAKTVEAFLAELAKHGIAPPAPPAEPAAERPATWSEAEPVADEAIPGRLAAVLKELAEVKARRAEMTEANGYGVQWNEDRGALFDRQLRLEQERKDLLARLPKIREQEGGGPPGPGAPRGGVPPSPPTAPMEEAPRAPGATPDAISVDDMIATGSVSDKLAFKNPVSGTAEEKAAQLLRLGEENAPLVRDMLSEIDWKYGTSSKDSFKDLQKIIEKANRPTIKEVAPEFGVEHIRDAYRFKTVLEDASVLPEILSLAEARGMRPVKIDTDMLVNPKKWGFRAAVVDMQMPNGQLVEWYLPVREIEEVKKEMHKVYEVWRNEDVRALPPERLREYEGAVALSQRTYGQAWNRYLKRTGQDERAVRAALARLSSSMPVTESKSRSSVSGVSGLGYSESGRQPLPGAMKAPTPPEITTTTPFLSRQTMGESVANPYQVWNDEEGRAETAGQVYRNANGSYTFLSPETGDRLTFPNEREARAAAARSATPEMRREGPIVSEAPETLHRHMLQVQRGERGTGRARLTTDEFRAAAVAASELGTTPQDVEAKVRAAKRAHPESGGWAPLAFLGTKKVGGKRQLKYQTIPYTFSNGPDGRALVKGTPEYTERARALAGKMRDKVRDLYERAKGGEEEAIKILSQARWYRAMREGLRRDFGGLGDLFADLLGATSPQTPVRTNWDSAIDALRQATTGAYDKLIPKWEAWVEEVDQFNTAFLAFFNEKQEQGLSKKAIKELPEYKAFEERAKTVRELPAELRPTKANGKLFGTNTNHVVRALVGLWRTVRVANEDIGAGGQAPKALNFSGNLIGFKTGATIDVWAARMLQDLSGGLRIPYEAEVGVSGTLDPGGTSNLQFGFGQDVFHEAAGMIRSDPEMSSDKNLKEIADDDLQAVVWFLEKEKWTKNNWTSAAGEGGSFEFERALAGVNPKEQERVRELRKAADTTVSTTPAQRRHAQEQLRLAQLQMETMPRVARAKATLKRNQVERAKLGRGKGTEARREALAKLDEEARAELAAAKETRAYQTLQKQAEAAKAVLAKPTLEESKASRKAAADELSTMARGVDRFTTGVTTATEEHVPTDKEMASLIKKVTDAVRKGDPGATLVALKAIATEGRYGQVERSLDMEVIVRAGFDARPLARTIFQVAKDSGQDTAFLARVLRQDEEYDPLLHHPGVEIYFRNQMEAEEAARYMANILETRVAKARKDGTLTHFQVGGYTVIVDGRPTAETKAGKMGRPVGMRVLYMPEHEARYGIDERLKDATPEELTAIVEERKGDLEAYAKEVLRAFPNVSYAGLHHYEVDVRFAGEYEEAINGYSERSSGDAAQAGRSQVWQGRSLGEGIAAAVGRLQAAEGRAAGTLSDGDQAGPRVAEDVAPPKKAAAPPKLRSKKPGTQGELWPAPPKEKSGPKWLGLNIAKEIKTEGSAALVGKVVQSAEDLATLAQVYRDPRYETFRFFFVDQAGKIVYATGVSSRLPSVTGIIPAGMTQGEYIAFLQHTMASSGAVGYYLMHNHPSGNPTPSRNDIVTTVDLSRHVQGFLGHVIINSNKYAYLSADDIARIVFHGGFSELDLLAAVEEKKFNDKDPLLAASIPSPYLGLKATGPDRVAEIGGALKRDGYAVLVGIDARSTVRGLMEIPAGTLRSLAKSKSDIKEFAVNSGSHFVAVYTADGKRYDAVVRDLIEYGYLVDWVAEVGDAFESYRENNPMVMPQATMGGEQIFHFGERPEMNASVVMENFAQDGRYDLVATGARNFKAPKKTVKAYKLFRVARDGTLRPLFIDKSTPVPVGQWIPATHIPTKGFQERPGWHAGHLPIAPHLRQKSTGRVNANRVWVEVEMPADVDWQAKADASRTRDIRDRVPAGGYYRFTTNKMQGDAWMIGGALKVNRVLSDKEVASILQGAGYTKEQIDGEMHPGGEPRTAHSLKAAGFRRPTFEADLADQIRVFEAAAAERGYASVDELASREPIYFEEVAREWRETHPGAGVLDGIIASGMVHLSTDRSHHVRITGPEADLQRARSVLAGRYGRMESDLRHVGGELQVTIPSWYSMDEVADSMKGLGLEVEATPAQEARTPGDALAEQWARALANVQEGEITATGMKRDVTQTKEFKDWFGDSKVVDEQGRPLVVYHGTYSKFDTFTPGRAGAIYFFPSRQAAAGYGPNVVAAYLKASRIADLTDPSSDGYKIAVKAFNDRGGWSDNEDAMEGRSNPNFDPALDHTWEMFDWGALREPLREAGFDGVKLNEYDGKVSYAVFEPTQVKSADKNNGDFDKTNPIITAKRATISKAQREKNFIAWSGGIAIDQVVSDASPEGGAKFATGKPFVAKVYHGTPTGLEGLAFDESRLGSNTGAGSATLGFFTAGSQTTSDAYTSSMSGWDSDLDIEDAITGDVSWEDGGPTLDFKPHEPKWWDHRDEVQIIPLSDDGKEYFAGTFKPLSTAPWKPTSVERLEVVKSNPTAKPEPVLVVHDGAPWWAELTPTEKVELAEFAQVKQDMEEHNQDAREYAGFEIKATDEQILKSLADQELVAVVDFPGFWDTVGYAIRQEKDGTWGAASDGSVLGAYKTKGEAMRALQEKFDADIDRRQNGGDPVVYELFLKAKNPFVYDYKGRAYRERSYYDVISKAKKKGHDAVVLLNTYDGGGKDNIFVFFDPTQVKSATDNVGTFDKTNPIITASRHAAPLWYSKLTRAVAGHKMAAMPATQWSSWLETAAPKLGIPKDEIEWSGLREWLALQKGKLTRDQVRDYLEQNGVKVKEVELALKQSYAEEVNAAAAELGEEVPEPRPGAVRFSRWQLPGGTNYRELLLTLPRKEVVNVRLLTQEEIDANGTLKAEGAKAGDWWGVIDDKGAPVNGAWRTREQAEEALDDLRNTVRPPTSERTYTGRERTKFRSTHFDQPNILAHVRFNERTDADGKRVLFLEEMQSDWAQQGRKEGFAKAKRERFGEWAIANDHAEPERLEGWLDAHFNRPGDSYWNEYQSKAKVKGGEGVPVAPFVTDTKAWVALALKRMIRYAAENGFDRVAWTTGEQQAERYDLSKQVSALDYKQHEDGTYYLSVITPTGDEKLIHAAATEEKLEDFIGKDVAQRIRNKHGTPSKHGLTRLSGLDLKVGGEGMRAFYDGIVPQVANDVLKKLGGGKVGQVSFTPHTTIKVVESEGRHPYRYRVVQVRGDVETSGLGYASREEAERAAALLHDEGLPPQPGFDITPELREKVVTEGMAVMGSRHEPPVWYSRLDKLIGEHKMKAMIPSQWKAWLESKAKQEGLGEEVFWSGITEYLGKWNRALPLSKEMLRSYLAQRGIKIKTTVLTSDPRAVRERAVEEAIASYEIAALWTEGNAERTENLALVRKLGQEYIEKGDVRSYNAFADEVGVPRDTFHTNLTQAGYELEPGYDRSGFQLPGGTNYREIVLSLPAEVTKHEDGDYEAEWLGRRGTGKTEQAALERAGAYLGGHYGDKPNVVGHLRVTDRMINGKRVYFIEEVQSDWAQTGRDEGFGGTPIKGEVFQQESGDWGVRWPDGNFSGGYSRAQAELLATRGRQSTGVPAAPFVRNTEAWVTLLLKHAVMDAIRGGYDAIAWTTGAQQAARYKLSRFVNALHVTHLDVQVGRPPMLRLDAYDRNGNLSITRDVEPQKLAGYIGKELAADVMEQLERQGAAKVEGVDLDMGSEAMTRFYGDASGSQVGVDANNKPLYPIMHLVANKLLRRLGGENVVPFDASAESVSVIKSAEGGYKVLEGASVYSSHTSEEAAQKAAAGLRKLLQGKIIEQQPGFVITPAMRDTILSKGMAVVGSQSTATQNGEWQEPAPESVARAARILAGRTDVMETIGWNKGDRLQSLDPDQVHLMSRLIAAALEAGVPEANFHATSFYTYPMIYSGNDAEYIGTYKIVGVSSDNLNRVIALERVLARIKGEGRVASAYRGDVSRMLHQLVGDIIHETSHLIDDNPNKRTNGGDFRTSGSSEFAMEHDEKRGTITVNSELMREVMEVWASGPTRLQDDLDYPIRFVFHGEMDTKTAKSEVLAQLTMLYFTRRDLMREHMPVAYKFLEAIYEGDVRPKSIHEAHARVQGAIRALPHQWPNHIPATWRAARVREQDATGARKWRAGPKLGGRRTAKGPGGGQRGADGGGTGATHSPAAEVQRAVDALEVRGVVRAARAATGGQAYKDRVSVAWKWIDDITSINRIPNLDSYLIMRKLALGQLSRVDDTVRELYDLFKDAGAHSADIYNFLTSKGASPTIIADQRLRAAAVRAKNLMIRVGEQLVARGLLDPATFAANRGAYLPRLYLAHLLGDEFVTAVSSGKRPSAMNYLKRRKDLSAHVREVILGEIKDPAFLVSKGFGVASRDMVLIDWMAQIAQNRDWVLPGTLVDWQGRRVTPYWLLKTADRIEMQADYYQGQAKIDATNTAAAMRTAARAALNSPAWANVPKGWKQLPDTPRYGQLRGMVVRSEIYEDIIGNVDISGDEMSWARYMMGPLAEKATGLWKWSKVAANPPAQVRNAISNLIMLHLSGVPAHRLAVLVPKAIEEYMTKGGYYQIFVKYGGKEGTFAVQELYRTDREFRDTLSRMAGKGDLMAGLRNIAGRIYDATGDAYQWIEGVGKLIKIMDEMERNGATEERAVLEADRWLFDYSLVNPAIRDLRRMPIGVPFLTFYTKALPRLLEAALLRPWKFAPYLAIPILLAQMLAGSADVDDDDVEALLKALPEWLQKRGHGYILPTKDASGRWVAMDFGYFFPWTMWTEMIRNVGEPAELLLGAGALGGPIPEIVAALKTGIDPFTGDKIVRPGPPAQQVADVMQWIWNLSAPGWLTERGAVHKMWQALGTPDLDRDGYPKSTVGQAALRFVGVNLYPINPDITRARNLRRMKYEIQELRAQMSKDLRGHPTMSAEDRREVIESYQDEIKAIQEKMAEYEAESRIHPNLRTTRPTATQAE